jgi:hypothetical protein
MKTGWGRHGSCHKYASTTDCAGWVARFHDLPELSRYPSKTCISRPSPRQTAMTVPASVRNSIGANPPGSAAIAACSRCRSPAMSMFLMCLPCRPRERVPCAMPARKVSNAQLNEFSIRRGSELHKDLIWLVLPGCPIQSAARRSAAVCAPGVRAVIGRVERHIAEPAVPGSIRNGPELNAPARPVRKA